MGGRTIPKVRYWMPPNNSLYEQLLNLPVKPRPGWRHSQYFTCHTGNIFRDDQHKTATDRLLNCWAHAFPRNTYQITQTTEKRVDIIINFICNSIISNSITYVIYFLIYTYKYTNLIFINVFLFLINPQYLLKWYFFIMIFSFFFSTIS